MKDKAKRKDNGEWVEGYYLNVVKIDHFICTGKIRLDGAEKGIIAPEMYAIDPDTLCRYTELDDKNGRKIWENDIVKCNKRKEGYDLYKVVWRKDFADFGVEPIKPKFESRYPIGLSECDTIYGYDYKVIGNIFDNPELLGG